MSKKIEYFVGMINKGIEIIIVTSMFFILPVLNTEKEKPFQRIRLTSESRTI